MWKWLKSPFPSGTIGADDTHADVKTSQQLAVLLWLDHRLLVVHRVDV